MKILAISDVPSKLLWDESVRKRLEGIDLILSCGDLPKKYLEYLTNFTTVPILYVHGNHDGSYKESEPGGCICVDDAVYVWKGLRIMGLGGCNRYNRDDTFQYTEAEMRRRARKLWLAARRAGGIDILLTHAPASGLNDGTDKAHKGFQVFNDLMDLYQPKWFIHGHMHLNYGANLPRVCTRGGTTVINATERYEFEIPDPVQVPKRKPHPCANRGTALQRPQHPPIRCAPRYRLLERGHQPFSNCFSPQSHNQKERFRHRRQLLAGQIPRACLRAPGSSRRPALRRPHPHLPRHRFLTNSAPKQPMAQRTLVHRPARTDASTRSTPRHRQTPPPCKPDMSSCLATFLS